MFLFTESVGTFSATGLGKEATFGLAVPRINWAPMVDNTMEVDPGLFFPPVIVGQADESIFGLYGQEKDLGAINMPLFPTNGIPLLAYALGGTDTVTGSSPGPYTHSIVERGAGQPPSLTIEKIIGGKQSLIMAGCKVAKYSLKGQATDTEASAAVDIVAQSFQVGTAAGVASTIASGSNTQVLPQATINLTSDVTATAPDSGIAYVVTSAGTEIVTYTGITASTITGCTGGTGTMSTGGAVTFSATMGTPSYVNEEPFVFAEFILTWAGGQLSQAGNFALDIETGVKPTYTFNGSHEAQFITATKILAKGSFDVVWDDLVDSDDLGYDFFTQIQQMANGGMPAALTFALTHPSTGYGITLSMPNVFLSKSQHPVKLGDVVMETLDFTAARPPGASSTISATIVNGVSTSYSP
ncbi:MAG: hypothetical protein V4472_25495 [Pseudomonadota bacterium]